MNKSKLLLFVAALTLAAFAFAADQPIQIGKGHLFACGDYSGNKVCIIDADGKVLWQHKAPHCNEVWVLANGNILFTTGKGVKEVTRDNKVVFDFQPKSEIYACQRLADGNTFVGDCGRGKLLEVDPKGKVVKELNILPKGRKKGGHGFMRNARKLANGNYLCALYSDQVVREYDSEGKMVREIKAPGGAHSCVRLKNGNTMIACGDRKKKAMIIEVDKDDKIVWQISNDDLEGNPLKFMTGFHVLPNNNVVMTNWIGHGHIGKAPQILEVTRDKKILWQYQDHKTLRTAASIQVLDVKGDPVKGEVQH
jgi:hypothetical protein